MKNGDVTQSRDPFETDWLVMQLFFHLFMKKTLSKTFKTSCVPGKGCVCSSPMVEHMARDQRCGVRILPAFFFLLNFTPSIA